MNIYGTMASMIKNQILFSIFSIFFSIFFRYYFDIFFDVSDVFFDIIFRLKVNSIFCLNRCVDF